MNQDQEQERKPTINVSIKKQKDLIRLVIDERQSIVKMAKKLKLKYNRAKTILKIYRETGQFLDDTKTKKGSRSDKQHSVSQSPQQNSPQQSSSQSRLQPYPILEPLPEPQQPVQEAEPFNYVFFLYPYYPWNPLA